MPKRKQVRKLTKKEDQKNNFLSQFKLEESYISLIIGIIVIILIAGGVVFLVRNNRTSDTSSLQYKPTIDIEEGESDISGGLPTSYEIKEGDSLWTISEKFYKSGYNWVDIVKSNNLNDPSIIHVGNKLTIPNVKKASVTVLENTDVPTATQNQIVGATYKVKKGDYLWDIAIRAYGDGYQWVKIAKANNLSDPNLIFSDNVLKIPR